MKKKNTIYRVKKDGHHTTVTSVPAVSFTNIQCDSRGTVNLFESGVPS